MIEGYKLSKEAARVANGLPPFEPARVPVKVSTTAVANSRTRRRRAESSPLAMDAKSIYAPLKYPPEVYPDAEIAMDYAPGGDGCNPGLASWAAQSLFHEGQGFFGYPYLAELFQRSEYRNACEIWAEHAVRKWIKFVNVDEKKQTELEKAFKSFGVRDTIYRWCLQDHEYGRGQIFLDFGDADNTPELAVPLLIDSGKINPKRPLKRLTIVEPMWCAPGFYVSNNPLAADFYKPVEWFAYGRKVAATRLLTLVSRQVSDMLKPAYGFGGQALTQIMKPYVDNWLRARQSSSDLLDAHSQPVLSTDMSSILGGGGGEDFYRRMEIMQNGRNNRGLMALDKASEEFSFVTTPLSGVSDLVGQSLEQVCVAARIPQSIYLQNQPTGLNANSEGEVRGFYTDVHGYQEKNLRPGLKIILDLVQLSIWGDIDPEVDFVFNPLWEMTDKDKADIRKSDAEADATYIDRGVVSPDEVRERLAEEEEGLYATVDLTGPAPELPELDPTDEGDNKPGDAGDPKHVGDEFREDDHPRADNGQFGSGGGGAAPAKSKPEGTAKPAKGPAPVGGTTAAPEASTVQAERAETGRMQAVKRASTALPAPGSLPSPKTVRQPFTSWEQAGAMGEQAQAEYTKILTQIGRTMGLDLSPPAPDKLPKDFKGPALFIGRLKSQDRAEEKVTKDYGGDWSQLKDMCRATISVDTIEELGTAVDKIKASGLEFVADPKNNYAKPTPSGYRDFNTLVRLPNGMIAELQFNTTPMLVAKAEAHHYYETERSLDAKYETSGPTDAWSAEDRKTYENVTATQRQIYGDAWKSLV